jgi:hypothetical protein
MLRTRRPTSHDLIPDRSKRFACSVNHPNRLWDSLSSIQWLPGAKSGHEADHASSPIAEVKSE